MPTYTEAIKSWHGADYYKYLYGSFLQGKPNDSSLYSQKVIVNNKLNFQICQHLMFVVNGSKILFAYSIEGNKIQRRFFYKSTSTGCWRVGSGFEGYRFKKGINETIGYVYEGQVCGRLETALTQVAAKVDATNILYDNDLLIHLTADSNCEIFSEFRKESAFLFHREIPSNYTNEISYTTLKHKAIPAQYAISSNRLNLAQGEELIKKIKDNFALWELLTRGLNNEIGTYQFYFEILKSNVKVHIYSLYINQKEVRFEIAHCLNFTRHIIKNGKQINLQPVWVKSVYFPTVSSFGNYRQYPKNLSFLPQKPIDYNLSNHRKHIFGKYIRYHSAVERKGFSYYHHLSAHNEKYNMLVRVFKEKYQHNPTAALTSESKHNSLFHTSSAKLTTPARKTRFPPLGVLSSEAKHHSHTASSTMHRYTATKQQAKPSHQLTCAYSTYSVRKRKVKVFIILQKAILSACRKYLIRYNHKSFSAPRHKAKRKIIAIFAELIKHCDNLKQIDSATQRLLASNSVGSLRHGKYIKIRAHATDPHYSTYFFLEIMRATTPIRNLLVNSGGLKRFPANGSKLIILVKKIRQQLKKKMSPRKLTLLTIFTSPFPYRDFI